MLVWLVRREALLQRLEEMQADKEGGRYPIEDLYAGLGTEEVAVTQAARVRVGGKAYALYEYVLDISIGVRAFIHPEARRVHL